jgi:hypothetical protein
MGWGGWCRQKSSSHSFFRVRWKQMSHLAAKHDVENSFVDLEFIIANPSSYTYLDDRRWMYGTSLE